MFQIWGVMVYSCRNEAESSRQNSLLSFHSFSAHQLFNSNRALGQDFYWQCLFRLVLAKLRLWASCSFICRWVLLAVECIYRSLRELGGGVQVCFPGGSVSVQMPQVVQWGSHTKRHTHCNHHLPKYICPARSYSSEGNKLMVQHGAQQHTWEPICNETHFTSSQFVK